MKFINRHYLMCDHCGKVSDMIYEGDGGGMLPMGWGHAKVLAGWWSLTIKKTDAEIAADARKPFGFHVGVDDTYYLCGKVCTRDFLGTRAIPKSRIAEVREQGTPPPPRKRGGWYPDNHVHPDAVGKYEAEEPDSPFSGFFDSIFRT
jgi:hypothetical protein